MWAPSSLIRDQISVPYIARQILNHWITREVLGKHHFNQVVRVAITGAVDVMYPLLSQGSPEKKNQLDTEREREIR